MTKNKWIDLGIIAVSFLLFFWPAFLSFGTTSPLLNLFSFVFMVAATLAAIIIGNNEATNNHHK